MVSILFDKHRAPFRHRYKHTDSLMSDSTQAGTSSRQTADRPVTTNYREMEDTGSESQDLNLGLLLATLICTLFSLFSVMSMYLVSLRLSLKHDSIHNAQ